MIDTEEEREKFLVVLLALSKRIERAAKKSFNDVFLKAMMKLRRLILRLERGGLIRTLQWDRLRSEIIEILRPIIEVLQSTLPRHLLELDPLAIAASCGVFEREGCDHASAYGPGIQQAKVFPLFFNYFKQPVISRSGN